MFDGLRLAVGTLTVVPVGTPRTVDRPVAGRAMLVASVAVVPLALFAGAVGGLGAVLGLPELGVGLLVVGALAVGTRALHLDGLADTVDGLGAGWDRERSLAVMRRGDVGPMGVVALIVTLGLQAVAIGRLLHGWPGALLVAVLVCASRGALLLVCVHGVPAARPEGLGAMVAETVSRPAALVGGVVLVAVLGVAYGVLRRPTPTGAAAGLGAAVAVAILVRRAVRRFGGVTGDVMGAAIELALTVLLVGATL